MKLSATARGHKINIYILPLQQLTKKFCNMIFLLKKFGGLMYSQ